MTVEDLDSDSTYVVKIVVFSAGGKRSHSDEKTDKITGPSKSIYIYIV